jgi:23S rRNA (guanosine2251-2'-O)-methyltransferase
VRRDEEGSVWIEGVRPVLEALRAGRRRVLEVAMPEDDSTPGQRALRAALREHRVATTSAGPEGVRARAEPYVEETLEALLSRRGPHFLVALDRVTDVGNLGSIARSAEAAGVTGLVLEYRHAPPIGPGALRASAGALEHLAVARTPNLRKGLELARGEGLSVLVADAAGEPFDQLPAAAFQGDLIWVLGSEDRGVREGIQALATQIVGISLHGKTESLGVAAAAAILLHGTASHRLATEPAGGY